MEKIKDLLITLLAWFFENSPWIVLAAIAGYVYISIRSSHTTLLLATPVAVIIGAVLVYIIIDIRKWRKERAEFAQYAKKQATIDFQKDPKIIYTNYTISKHQYTDSRWEFNLDELELKSLSEDDFELKWKNPSDTRDLTIVLQHIRKQGILFGLKEKKIYSFTTLFQDTKGNVYIEWIMYRNQHMAETGATDMYAIPAGWTYGYQEIDKETMAFL